jgi:hypothetical protein
MVEDDVAHYSIMVAQWSKMWWLSEICGGSVGRYGGSMVARCCGSMFEYVVA